MIHYKVLRVLSARWRRWWVWLRIISPRLLALASTARVYLVNIDTNCGGLQTADTRTRGQYTAWPIRRIPYWVVRIVINVQVYKSCADSRYTQIQQQHVPCCISIHEVVRLRKCHQLERAREEIFHGIVSAAAYLWSELARGNYNSPLPNLDPGNLINKL